MKASFLFVLASLLFGCASFQQGRVLRLAHYPKDLPMKIGSFTVEGASYSGVFERGVRQLLEFSLREKGLPLIASDAPDPDAWLEIEVVCLVTQPEPYTDAPSIVNFGLTSRFREKQKGPVVAWQGNWVFRNKPLLMDESFLLALRHVAFCVWADGRPLPPPKLPPPVAPKPPIAPVKPEIKTPPPVRLMPPISLEKTSMELI